MRELNGTDIFDFAVWDDVECAEVASRVYDLKDYWITRGSGGFDTLGATLYIDDPWAYAGIAAMANKLLERYFYETPLFKKFISVLEAAYEEEVITSPTFALPGFHIFTEKSNKYTGGHIHMDSAFSRMVNRPEFDSPSSFTVVVEAPETGAALNYWLDGEVPQTTEPHVCNYKKGHLYLHSGLFFHQIRKTGDFGPNEARITLQGHGIRLKEGGVLVYF